MGLIPGRLERIAGFLDSRFIARGRIPMWQVQVARHGEVVWQGQGGLADVERRKPVADDTIFRIYSMTKPVTAVALLSLFEEGRFRLDDPVGRYLHGWREQEVWVSGRGEDMVTAPSKRAVTIRDMLRHTSGLTYGNTLRAVGAPETQHPVDEAYQAHGVSLRPDQSMSEFVDRISRVPLRHQPGEGWSYSLASDVCGALVEAIAGEPFADVLRRRVLDPLGMRDTDFSVPAAKVERFASNYTLGADRKLMLIDDAQTSPYLEAPTFCSGGGGLVATTRDYHKFCEMLRRGGEYEGTRILAPRTVRLMLTNQLPGGQDIDSISQGIVVEHGNAGVGFGLGIATCFDPVKTGTLADGDAYWAGVASTLFWIDQRAGLSVIFMTQLTPPYFYDFRNPLRSLVYSSLSD